MASMLREPGSHLVVDDTRVRARHWQAIDLGGLQRALNAPPQGGTRAAARFGALAPASPVPRASPRNPARLRPGMRLAAVPRDAFVVVGREAAGPKQPQPGANDNAVRRLRPVLRDVVLLALLFATVAGAFYSGRLHAMQKVIVVPLPANPGSAVT